MKKIFTLCIIFLMAVSFAACNKGTENQEATEEKNNMSGINSEVTKNETSDGAEYTFEGYFSTKVPAGTTAEDISINTDSTLFTFQNGITVLDVSFAENLTSEESVEAKVQDLATIGNASLIDPIVINGYNFYGVNTPDYGMIRYIGFVNNQDVTVSVYTELENEVVQAFIQNTVFVVDETKTEDEPTE